MKKVTIKKLPEMKRGGTSYPNIPMQIAPWSVHNTAGAPFTETRKSVEPDYDNPNIEAEGGEAHQTMVNGMPAFFNINGPSHAEGGVPMRATEDDFIFSKFLKMPKDVAEYFGYTNKKGKSKTSKYSYADAAKKFGGIINNTRQVMADPNATKLDVSTAELNLKNAIDKLGQVALAQEASKGFEDIPSIAMPYLMRVGADPSALMPLADNEQMEQTPDNEAAEGETPMARYGGELPKAQTGRMRRLQNRINNLRVAQAQPHVVVDRNTGVTYIVDGYGNIVNAPFGQQPVSRTTTVKFKPKEGATVITRNVNESDPEFEKRVKEEFNKAKNKQEVYVVKADGGYQKVTKTSIAKKLPSTYTADDRLGGLNNDYADVEATLKDPANKGIVDRMYEEYKRQIDASNLSASRKAELKKKSAEEVLDNFLKAQKQVFAITKAELDKSINPITGDKSWDKGGGNKNKVYNETLKKLGFSDDEIFNEDQIAMFQGAYKGIQAAADDPKYKSTLERFTLNPRGMSDQQDAAGRAISPVDDIFGNTTAGQGLFVKNPVEDGVAFEDVPDSTTTEQEDPGPPTYRSSDHELEYLGPDVNNMIANLAIGANQPNVMPTSFPMGPIEFNQAYLDPSREVAETQGTAQNALRASGVYGSPQSYAAAAAATQAQASNTISNTLSKYFNANNEIYNNAEKLRADLGFKINSYNLGQAKQYYDEMTNKIQNQKDNQNFFIAQTTLLKNAMDANAAQMYNMEEASGEQYRFDKPTMAVYFNKGKKLTGQQEADEYETKLANMQELMKRGVSADKAAQVIFGSKGVTTPESTDEITQFNQMLKQYNMGNPEAAAQFAQYAQAAGTGVLPYMFGGLI